MISPTVLPKVNNKEKSTQLPRVGKQISVIDKLQQTQWQRTQEPNKKDNLRSNLYPPSYRAQAARTLLAQHIFTMLGINHIYDTNGKRLTVDKLLKGPQAPI